MCYDWPSCPENYIVFCMNTLNDVSVPFIHMVTHLFSIWWECFPVMKAYMCHGDKVFIKIIRYRRTLCSVAKYVISRIPNELIDYIRRSPKYQILGGLSYFLLCQIVLYRLINQSMLNRLTCKQYYSRGSWNLTLLSLLSTWNVNKIWHPVGRDMICLHQTDTYVN